MNKVLVIAPQWLGDAVMSHSLILLLAKDHVVDVLCANWLKPVYERMPLVHHIHTIDVQHGKFQWSLYRQTAKNLKHEHYHACYVIPRKLKAALIPWLAGIPKRIGYLGESRYWLINQQVKPQQKHHYWIEKVCGMAKTNAKLKNLPSPELTVDEANKSSWSKRLIDTDNPIVALMPGASYGPSKQWPIQNFQQLAGQLSERYQVVILGGSAEFEIGETIAADNQKIINLANKTTLQDTIDILSLCKFSVTNDSGLMHIAAAVGCYVHALYGSSSPNYTPPLTPQKLIYSDALECKPCFKRSCEFGHYNCWKDITVQRVLDHVE